MPNKSFGKHIEDGLTSLGNAFVEHSRDAKKWNDESRSLGLISTADKLRWLEAEAYRKTRVDKDITQELQLMEYLLKAQKYQNQLVEKNGESFANFIFLLARILIASSSAFLLWQGVIKPTDRTCFQFNKQSDYCQLIREKAYFFIGK